MTAMPDTITMMERYLWKIDLHAVHRKVLEEFSIDIWNSLVEYATVYSTDDIRFTFKNGQEIKA